MASVGDVERLRGRWRELWRALHVRVVPERTFEELVEAYEQPHRTYHCLNHVADCLRVFDTVVSEADRPSEVEAAIWFHDAVYDPKHEDNESRSADWAAQILREVGAREAATERIRALILATRHEVPGATQDARLLLDIDLSILGRSPSEFAAYEEQIRREYAWVPDQVFHGRRGELLEGFLRREPLYLTPALRSRFESQARANLAAAVKRHRGASDERSRVLLDQ